MADADGVWLVELAPVADPGLVPALLGLVRDSARGDPESPLLWTTKSAKHLSGALTAAGHRCSPQTAWRLLREQGFSTQANAKVAEGRRHPDRDAQFRYIRSQGESFLGRGWPVISVDTTTGQRVIAPAIAITLHSIV